MTTATQILKSDVQSLSNLNCEVHALLVEDGRCTCAVDVRPKQNAVQVVAGSALPRPKQRYTIMSDEDCHYYFIPTDKEQAFEAWVAATVNGEEEDYYENEGEDFTEYAVGGALTRLTFENPSVN